MIHTHRLPASTALLIPPLLLALLGPSGAWAETRAASVPSDAARGGVAVLASGPASSTHDEGKLPRADAAFLKQAAENGHAEVEGSKLALTKSTNMQVKSFAQKMVDDHTKAGDALAALASSKGVEVPTGPALAQKAKLKLLSARDGVSFDKHYADSIGVSAHEDTVKLFRKAADQAQDPDVKAFAAKTLPTLVHHLEMAKDLKALTDKEKQ